jgi:ectoine hydroxylase-related dioxygenase (phytanoyl-CoA dioxygenase family)
LPMAAALIQQHGSESTGVGSQPMAPVDELGAQGFVVLPALVGTDEIRRIREQLAAHLTGHLFGRNDFEGFRTERVYALLAKAPAVAALVEHPAVLDLVEAVLQPAYLLSAVLAINVHPGQTAQTLHADDGYCRIPRPRRPLGVSAIWAIEEFTPDNGATEVIPESHTWGDEATDPGDRRIEQIVMSPGSVVVFLGTLLHRGGANRSNGTRLAITPQYCEPWIRQIENMTLAIPPSVASRFSHRVQAMLGYSIYPPFIGYVDGRDPRRLLTAGYASS